MPPKSPAEPCFYDLAEVEVVAPASGVELRFVRISVQGAIFKAVIYESYAASALGISLLSGSNDAVILNS